MGHRVHLVLRWRIFFRTRVQTTRVRVCMRALNRGPGFSGEMDD